MADGTETAEAEGFEWMMVEIFGHRSHWGKGKEVERFGSKMLRIDVPQVLWSEPTSEQPEAQLVVAGWVTHFYGGSAIFSNTLTDEATALRRNAPYSKPGKFLPPPATGESAETPTFGDDRSDDYDFEYQDSED